MSDDTPGSLAEAITEFRRLRTSCGGTAHARFHTPPEGLLRQLAGPHPIFQQLGPELSGIGAQVGDAVGARPDLDPGCPFQECASRAHRLGVRSALDGMAGRDVVGRVELVKAVMAHARERPAAAQVPPTGADGVSYIPSPVGTRTLALPAHAGGVGGPVGRGSDAIAARGRAGGPVARRSAASGA